MHRAFLSVPIVSFLLLACASPAGALTAPPVPAGHPAQAGTVTAEAHRVAPATYKVRSGDTLSSIARRVYGHSWRWPDLWWPNRHRVHNPSALHPGLVLELGWHPRAESWVSRKALAAIPHPRPQPQQGPVAPVTSAAASPVPSPQPESYSGAYPGGAFGACVVARESGGNPQVMNATGHYGLYQFAAGTWAAYGGNPADFGHASVAEQNAVFAAALAAGGQSNWSPYDGC